jgi:hypothetical protein
MYAELTTLSDGTDPAGGNILEISNGTTGNRFMFGRTGTGGIMLRCGAPGNTNFWSVNYSNVINTSGRNKIAFAGSVAGGGILSANGKTVATHAVPSFLTGSDRFLIGGDGTAANTASAIFHRIALANDRPSDAEVNARTRLY